MLKFVVPYTLIKLASQYLFLSSCLLAQVALEVPGWMRMVPLRAIEGTGSGVMQRVLDSMVPRFLRQLAADYALWAAGDDSRKPIGTGQL